MPAGANAGGSGPSIVGGTPASPGEYPAQGWLLIDLDPSPGFDAACGGSLVGSRWFLTAAHCALDATGFAVLLGDIDVRAPNTDWYGVVGADVNADYNGLTGQNDVAMLKLDRPAPYQPLRVISTNESSSWAPGTLARIIGWGTTSDGGNPSDVLLKADVPIVSDTACSTAYALHGPPMDPNTMVCAGDGIHDTCQGDSGGPLMVRDAGGNWALAGITSWGEGCADPNYPGVYTRVAAPALNAWVAWPGTHAPRLPSDKAIREQRRPLRRPRSTPNRTASTTSPGTSTAMGSLLRQKWGDVNWVFTTPGPHEVGVRASRIGGDTAFARQVINVNASPTVDAAGPNAPFPRVDASCFGRRAVTRRASRSPMRGTWTESPSAETPRRPARTPRSQPPAWTALRDAPFICKPATQSGSVAATSDSSGSPTFALA